MMAGCILCGRVDNGEGGDSDILRQERDQARDAARSFWDFLQEGCFADDVEYANIDTPEYELWVRKWVAREWAEQCKEWLSIVEPR